VLKKAKHQKKQQLKQVLLEAPVPKVKKKLQKRKKEDQNNNNIKLIRHGSQERCR
jgi:hypothetical protein